MNKDKVYINRSAVILTEVRHEFDGTCFVLVRYSDGGIGRFNFGYNYDLASSFAEGCTGDVSISRFIGDGDLTFQLGGAK